MEVLLVLYKRLDSNDGRTKIFGDSHISDLSMMLKNTGTEARVATLTMQTKAGAI